MKVKELMEALKDLEPNAEVLIASQPNWPFEIELAGVVTRAACDARDVDGGARPSPANHALAPTDVFLVEGLQLRYGSKTPFFLVGRHR